MVQELESSITRYLSGQFLIAMPAMSDPRFERTVIYLCAHNSDGAMGLVINRLVESLTFPDLLSQLGIESGTAPDKIRVHFGGPVETGRGFVLHSAEYLQDSSLKVDEAVALTATVDILRDMASGQGPRQSLLALGYAGWGPGQLDQEIQANGWLTVDADESLLFDPGLETKWERAIGKLGFDISSLSGEAGHA
jgi:putative transcriptional regulator